ncbi:hypothetical protein C8F01DRAFT_1181631 [Mycena amicta]|nr:hypothetical protein C8F01DRAFT_1181631 [Mycena amicta]
MDPFVVKNPGNILDTNTPSMSMRTKCVLVCVCRAWRRIAIQILYQHIVIRSPHRASLVLQVLRDSHYGHWTRHIEVYTHARGSNGIQFLQNVYRIFQCCSRLRMLSASWRFPVPREFLAAVSGCYGSTLQGLYWDEQKYSLDTSHASLSFLASFKSLRILDLRNFVGDPSLTESSPPTLPRVNHLILSNRGPSISHRHSSSSFQRCIPSLFTLVVDGRPPDAGQIAKLLDAHGATLTIVHLPSPSNTSDPQAPELSESRSSAPHVPPALFLRPKRYARSSIHCPSVPTPQLISDSHLPYSHPTLRRVALYSVRTDKLYPKPSVKSSPVTHSRTTIADGRAPAPAHPGVVSLTRDGSAPWGSLCRLQRMRTTRSRTCLSAGGSTFERDGVDFQDGEGVVWVYADKEEEDGLGGVRTTTEP